MRIPRLKISLQTLMLLVVAFVLGMATDDFRHRHDDFMDKARLYEFEAERHREGLHEIDEHIKKLQADVDKGLKNAGEIEAAKAEREKARKLADRCDEIRAEFERSSYIPFAQPPHENTGDYADYWIPSMSRSKVLTYYSIDPKSVQSPDASKPKE